jgi:ribosome maturation factor RimP
MLERNKIEDLIAEKIAEKEEQFFVVDLSISQKNKITLEIDHESRPVSIEDCIEFSRQLEHNLDREIEDFELEVSSAGLSNPFRVHKQYIKNIGMPVVVMLKSSKVIEGELIKVTNESIVVKTESKEKIEGSKKKQLLVSENEYKLDEINQTKLVITFK